MSSALMGVEGSVEQQPSCGAIDTGNPAAYKPKWLVLDDLDINPISL
jgi:hypothetical protein